MFGKSKKGKCDAFRGMLSPYVDNRLNPQDKQALESHLATCQGCGKELESLRETVKLLRCVPQVPVTRSFAVREASPSPVRARAGYGAMRWATAAIVMVLVVMAAGDLFHIYPEKAGPSLPDSVAMTTQTPGPTGSGNDRNGGLAESTPSLKALQPQPTPEATGAVPPSIAASSPSPEGTPSPAFGATPVSPTMGLTAPTAATPGSSDSATPVVPDMTQDAGASAATQPVAEGTESAPEPSASARLAEEGYTWPIRQIELSVLGVAVVMAGATIVIWRRRTSR